MNNVSSLISVLKEAIEKSENNKVIIDMSDALSLLNTLEYINKQQKRSEDYLVKKTIFEETYFTPGTSVTGAVLEAFGFDVDELIEGGYIENCDRRNK